MKLILLSLILFSAAAFSFAQTASTEVSKNGGWLTNSKGWVLPDLSKLKVEKRQRFRSVKNTPRKIYITRYDTKDLVVFVNNADGTPNATDRIMIYSLYVYDANRRSFCYRMKYSMLPKPGEAGVGVLFDYTFYDLDGDGKFESWYLDDTSLAPLKIPDWVKN